LRSSAVGPVEADKFADLIGKQAHIGAGTPDFAYAAVPSRLEQCPWQDAANRLNFSPGSARPQRGLRTLRRTRKLLKSR